MSDLTITDAPEEKQEPTPGEKKRGRPRGSKNTKSAQTVKRFGDELDALLKVIAMMWSMRDPVCGGVLNESSALIAHDIAELAGSSPAARKYLENTVNLGKLVPLVMHVMPLLMSIRDHHVVPRMEKKTEEQAHQGVTDEWSTVSHGPN